MLSKSCQRAQLAALMVLVLFAPLSSAHAQKPKAVPSTKAAPAAQNWLDTASFTPQGGVILGNPKASVHLIEYVSFTCSHCQDFTKEAAEPLKARYVATGKIRYELRPVLRNSADYIASLLARCQGAGPAFKFAEGLLLTPAQWIAGFEKLTEADFKPLQNLPIPEAMQNLARLSKIEDYFAAQGMPKALQQQCLGIKTHYEALETAQKQAFAVDKIQGTPTFVLNGQQLSDTGTWTDLEPVAFRLTWLAKINQSAKTGSISLKRPLRILMEPFDDSIKMRSGLDAKLAQAVKPS
jgi:protein-disulfide isomerase